jgi:hypothetical protein
MIYALQEYLIEAKQNEAINQHVAALHQLA